MAFESKAGLTKKIAIAVVLSFIVVSVAGLVAEANRRKKEKRLYELNIALLSHIEDDYVRWHTGPPIPKWDGETMGQYRGRTEYFNEKLGVCTRALEAVYGYQHRVEGAAPPAERFALLEKRIANITRR